MKENLDAVLAEQQTMRSQLVEIKKLLQNRGQVQTNAVPSQNAPADASEMRETSNDPMVISVDTPETDSNAPEESSGSTVTYAGIAATQSNNNDPAGTRSNANDSQMSSTANSTSRVAMTGSSGSQVAMTGSRRSQEAMTGSSSSRTGTTGRGGSRVQMTGRGGSRAPLTGRGSSRMTLPVVAALV